MQFFCTLPIGVCHSVSERCPVHNMRVVSCCPVLVLQKACCDYSATCTLKCVNDSKGSRSQTMDDVRPIQDQAPYARVVYKHAAGLCCTDKSKPIANFKAWHTCCRPLNVEERALMWRFRYSLTSEARALTKFLKCVDWADAQEARQAADLMQAWAPIAIADALELLSPDFSNEQVSLPSAVALCSVCCLLFSPC